ncbi:MAG TPA: precorrin-3B synthase [Rhizobiaceae bacterium]|nr:precorrin-3B synthase [Rhizobiaceae bacterium]
MNAPLLRRGECPTLATPMQTGDGLLARLNPIDGGLTPSQMIGLAEAAARHGNGILEVTQRGSLQIRGLTAESALLLSAEVDALGIAVRTDVPVETGPLAGLDPAEIADPGPLAKAIREGIATAGLGAQLGPKVSVVIDGGGRSMLDAVSADVRLTAITGGRWQVAIAGDAVTARAIRSATGADAVKTALDLLAQIAELGRSGRAKDLVTTELPIPGDMAGRTEGGAFQQLRNGRWAVFASLPFGQIDAPTLIDLVTATAAAGAAEIRLAPRRALIFLCPSEASAAAVLTVAQSANLITKDDDPRAAIAACAGAPACASGHIPARSLAGSIASELSEPFDLHVSGCTKRCAKTNHDGITLLGTPDGVDLVLEGTGTLSHVAKERAKAAIGRVAALIAAERQNGERDAAAARRIGAKRLTEAFTLEGR